MKKKLFTYIGAILLCTFIIYIASNYYKYHLSNRILKITNNSNRTIDFIISDSVSNQELHEMSQPYFNSTYRIGDSLIVERKKNEGTYYKKNETKTFAIPNNDWEDFLEKDKKSNLYILDIDSLNSISQMNMDSNFIKKVIIETIPLNIEYLDEKGWLINFNK